MPSRDDTPDADDSAVLPDRDRSGKQEQEQEQARDSQKQEQNQHHEQPQTPLEYTTSFDPATDSASERVILTIAALTDTAPEDLPPLLRVIDPDALDRVVERAATNAAAGEQEVWFAYAGFDVGLNSTGTITVRGEADTVDAPPV
ncbi:uncharacterized protein Nmag_2040 [Natrialba magadii ATCC 43099]|uniref:Halobacterial output domain-containing protein n=1 Tax=Natrialba magadii (strain ATCC 43099 / DSM 3394 / CCM 3739 / CIP 104546 / IAM 13178 / JCM 8861 / NBRC 102185 / NCIMB 2190 / MS3) TaxID=547559 RepID=D3SVK2_NATMM|nr:HalOD1 output domain-containing protein [Natrialba magadii]ADD05610.1 uncharacterized protein Nmag_2040 [Natrialba magadii ATCC 43099]ELY29977.1 hypothetical protein C500_10214 [Natrialba magadii ATCC 43099]